MALPLHIFMEHRSVTKGHKSQQIAFLTIIYNADKEKFVFFSDNYVILC